MNAVAFQNVPNIFVTLPVSQEPIEPLKLAVSENVPCMFVTLRVSHVCKLRAKAVAPLNVFCRVVTLTVFHASMSASLNDEAPKKVA